MIGKCNLCGEEIDKAKELKMRLKETKVEYDDKLMCEYVGELLEDMKLITGWTETP